MLNCKRIYVALFIYFLLVDSNDWPHHSLYTDYLTNTSDALYQTELKMTWQMVRLVKKGVNVFAEHVDPQLPDVWIQSKAFCPIFSITFFFPSKPTTERTMLALPLPLPPSLPTKMGYWCFSYKNLWNTSFKYFREKRVKNVLQWIKTLPHNDNCNRPRDKHHASVGHLRSKTILRYAQHGRHADKSDK